MSIDRFQFPYKDISSVSGILSSMPDGIDTSVGIAFIITNASIGVAPSYPWDGANGGLVPVDYIAVKNELPSVGPEGWDFYPPIPNWPIVNKGVYGDGSGQVFIYDDTLDLATVVSKWTPATTYFTIPNSSPSLIKEGETLFVPQNRYFFITDGFICRGDLIIDGDMVEVD